jgi:TonB-dependent starch-binding outer membrane protein SusC
MKSKIYFFLLLLFSFTSAISQKTVTGIVTSDKGEALSGVTVSVKGAKTATTTNESGHYSIPVPSNANAVLVFSYVGSGDKEIIVGSRSNINVSLVQTTSTLNDVVVVGYQTVRRKDLTAAVSSISSKQLKDIPTNSLGEALAGKLAGVQVDVSEGAPGADVDVFVRGRNSITQSGSPLFIVDGIQVENALSVLSPQDVESIDVLKDAAATAIYGARGSNGVFIITTKGGKNTGGKTTITYNAFAGTSKLSKELDMMDPYSFVLYSYERAMYTGNPTDTSVASQYINRMSNFDTIANYKNSPNSVDWQNKMLGRDAFQTTHNISVSGGSAATQYNLSATYNGQQGLLANSDFTRKLLNFRFDHKVSDHLKVGFNVRFNNQQITGAGTSDVSGAGTNRLRQYVRYRPLILPGQNIDSYDPSLSVANNPGNGLNLINPVQLMNAEYRKRNQTVYNLNGYVNYNFNKYLSFRSTFGYDNNQMDIKAYDDTITNNSQAFNKMPVLDLTNIKTSTINNSNVFTYSNPALFKSKHALDILIGEETYQVRSVSNAFEYRYFPVGTKPDVAFANLGLASPPAGFTQPKPVSSDVLNTQLSFFSRIGYKYNEKYLLTLNFRGDGSSLFGPNYSSTVALSDSTNHKWGYFPSASFAWRISRENFMKNIGFINDAKIRFSYGTSGNNRVAAYGYTTGYAPPSNAGYGLNDVLNYTLVFSSTRLGNPDIKWESLTSKNLGFDLTLLQNRINLTVDLYSNVTKNLLIDNKIDPSRGFLTQYQNLGTVRNNGLEIQLAAAVLSKKDFNWNANFNISFNSNKIIKLGSQDKFTSNSGWFSNNNPDDYLVQVGQQIGTMYGLKVDGFYKPSDFTTTRISNPTYPNLTWQYVLNSHLPAPSTAVLSDYVAPGQIKFRDINGDNQITLDSDRTVIGHALPKFTGGFNQQFSYKNFDLSVYINFSYGNDIYNANKLEFSNQYGVDGNMLSIMDGRWKVIDSKGNLIQKQTNSSTVIGISPDSLSAVNAGATIWQPIRTTTGFLPMSFAVEDGSFLRINNVTLGYTLPKHLLQRAKISNLRVYITAYNLATITGYSGYDPDVNVKRNNPLTPGVDYSAYPRGRTYIAGINLSF